jgi:hypothetical protein
LKSSLLTCLGAQVLTVKAREPKQGKSDEIPTPEMWAVPSYETDYRPTFRPPTSYLRGALRDRLTAPASSR